MPQFEDAAKLLSKTVTDLTQKKKGLEIDVVTYGNKVKELQRKISHLAGSVGGLETQKKALEDDQARQKKEWEDTKARDIKEIEIKRKVADIDNTRYKSAIAKEYKKLEFARAKYTLEKQALEIFELDLKQQSHLLDAREKEISDTENKLREQQLLIDKKSDLVYEKERSLAGNKMEFDNSIKDKHIKIDSDLKETADKLKEADKLVTSLNDKTLQLQKLQKDFELKNDTLNKKSFVLEGKERDLRKREILLKDREGLADSRSVI